MTGRGEIDSKPRQKVLLTVPVVFLGLAFTTQFTRTRFGLLSIEIGLRPVRAVSTTMPLIARVALSVFRRHLLNSLGGSTSVCLLNSRLVPAKERSVRVTHPSPRFRSYTLRRWSPTEDRSYESHRGHGESVEHWIRSPAQRMPGIIEIVVLPHRLGSRRSTHSRGERMGCIDSHEEVLVERCDHSVEFGWITLTADLCDCSHGFSYLNSRNRDRC